MFFGTAEKVHLYVTFVHLSRDAHYRTEGHGAMYIMMWADFTYLDNFAYTSVNQWSTSVSYGVIRK